MSMLSRKSDRLVQDAPTSSLRHSPPETLPSHIFWALKDELPMLELARQSCWVRASASRRQLSRLAGEGIAAAVRQVRTEIEAPAHPASLRRVSISSVAAPWQGRAQPEDRQASTAGHPQL